MQKKVREEREEGGREQRFATRRTSGEKERENKRGGKVEREERW